MLPAGTAKSFETMAKKSVSLGNGRSWGSQGEAMDYFRAIRDRYPPGSVVTSNADHDDLLALIKRYDLTVADGPEKEGVGVERFETRTNVTNGGRTVGFWVVRIDGTETDFSFIRAVAGAAQSGAEQLFDACRGAVFADIQSARIAYFAANADADGRVRCEVTGLMIRERDGAFDYVGRPFGGVVADWVRSKGWSDVPPPGVLTSPRDAQTTTVFADQAEAAGFRRFHREAARIRIVDKSGKGRGDVSVGRLLEL